MKKLVAAAWVVLAVGVGTSQAMSSANFSVTTSGTNWYLYCSVDSNSNGLSSFQIDLSGTGGTQVLTSTLMAPKYLNLSLGGFAGFTQFTSDGVVANGNVTGIEAGQVTAYGDTNNPAKDALVIQGIGQRAAAIPLALCTPVRHGASHACWPRAPSRAPARSPLRICKATF